MKTPVMPIEMRHFKARIESPTIPLEMCHYKAHCQKLSIPSEYIGMPHEVFVKSHHTGRTVLFRAVAPDHPLYDEDQWDGEQQVYAPVEDIKNVKCLVIYDLT